MSDSEIIQRSIGDPKVFGEIFDRHFDVIASFCVRRLGRTQGEDVAGDVFWWAFEHRHRFNCEHQSARPWLFGVAANLVRRQLRSTGRQEAAYDRLQVRESVERTDVASRVSVAVDAQRDLSDVLSVLRSQPTDEVETLLLYAWEQLSYAETAEALSIPVGTVRSRIHRVRQSLVEALEGSVQKPQLLIREVEHE